MHSKALLLLAGFASVALTHPIEPRNTVGSLPPVLSSNDQNVLDLALYLEHLEQSLYTGGYENFSEEQYRAAGFPPGFRDNVGVIAQHEATHAATISDILTAAGKPIIPPCEYKFPYNSPTSFVDLANMITSVGIGAYLGGAELISDDPTLEVAAGAIVTVEARHDTYLRTGLKGSPFPTAFDTALTAVFAYNLAQMFIVRCPQQLPIPILPKLTLEAPPPSPNLQPVAAGTELKFSYDPNQVHSQGKQLYIGIINSVSNVTYEEVRSCGNGCVTVPVPQGAGGAAFAVLTSDNGASEDQLSQNTLAGPAEVILS